jgi:hypothetical protein
MSSGQLYRPYSSDSEYDSDTDSDDSVINDGYTTRQTLLDVPGRKIPVPTNLPAPVSETQQIPLNAGTKFETQETRNTSLFTINSRDRDTRVYPLPTYFTIRLPKVFKNIKQINTYKKKTCEDCN